MSYWKHNCVQTTSTWNGLSTRKTCKFNERSKNVGNFLGTNSILYVSASVRAQCHAIATLMSLRYDDIDTLSTVSCKFFFFFYQYKRIHCLSPCVRYLQGTPGAASWPGRRTEGREPIMSMRLFLACFERATRCALSASKCNLFTRRTAYRMSRGEMTTTLTRANVYVSKRLYLSAVVAIVAPRRPSVCLSSNNF